MMSIEKVLPTDTAYRAVSFIQTYTGRAFWPLKPTKEALSIFDIAHALANQCRYSGHVRFFYSVAQHCVLLAKWLEDRGGSALDCLQILMHDSPEAYLVDIPRPVKQYMPAYRAWDYDIDCVIRDWMGWADIPRPSFQDELDSRIIVDERDALMADSGLDWGHNAREPMGVKITPMSPHEAETAFLMAYASYSRAATGKLQYLNSEWHIPVRVDFAVSSDSNPYPPDLIEVDVLGGVAKIRLRDAEGIIERDRTAGTYPRPKWEWWHGRFELTERAES